MTIQLCHSEQRKNQSAMAEPTLKPVIFLAFANPRADLRNLAKEERDVFAILDRAAQNGLCEVVRHQNVTLDIVLDVFQDPRYRNRIAVFHYGGHAESNELLLESDEGKSAVINAGGLTTFLSEQRGLRLVFLNGCSTQPQVQGLINAGVDAVIATSKAIDDAVATNFAVRFYTGLAGGAGVQTAYNEAVGDLTASYGNELRHFYSKQAISSFEPERWPWELRFRPGAELAKTWNLPDAVDNPLFGLPSLPSDKPLPDTPFRNILWFQREHAWIFFGRGSDVRKLYKSVTARDGQPIVLYYGQSGVGKSSLLAAGLLPRLEQEQTVLYARRDPQLGLLQTLATNLPGNSVAGDKASNVSSATDLRLRWCAVESETGKPLSIILDQAEEVDRQSDEAASAEKDAFLATLVAIFGNSSTRPQGRLLLGFRKEWLADIEKLLFAHSLPYNKVLLEPMDKRGVIEAVNRPAETQRLQEHFGLTVDPGLAEEIADNLLADTGSQVALTLQILLDKMWHEAKEKNDAHPLFDQDLYHHLRDNGLLLGDFLDQQLEKLRSIQPVAFDYGLALDLLAYHTTQLGYAEQRSMDHVRDTYAHQSDIVPGLIGACRDLSLLVAPAENRPTDNTANRLAHDTLAPLVRQRFEESDAPGQRARRILESKAVDWREGKEGTLLDEADLALVESGRAGMRNWKDDENRLVKASQHARDKDKKEEKERQRKEEEIQQAIIERDAKERRNLRIGITIIAVIAGIAVIAAFLAFRNARAATEQKAIATEHARWAQVRKLIAEAQSTSEENNLLSLSMLLAIEAHNTERTDQGKDLLRQGTTLLPEVVTTAQHEDAVLHVAFSPDSQWMASAGQDGVVQIRKVSKSTDFIELQHNGAVTALAYRGDGEQLAIGSNDGTVKLWQGPLFESGPSLKHDYSIWALAYAQDGSWLASADDHGTVIVWDVATLERILTISHDKQVNSVNGSLDSRLLATASDDGTVQIWDIPNKKKVHTLEQPDWVFQARFSPDAAKIATAGSDSTARIWDVESGKLLLILQHNGWLETLAFSPDGKLLATASDDNTGRLWDVETGQEIRRWLHEDKVVDIIFDASGRWLATASEDGTARVWDVASGREIARMIHDGPVHSVAFNGRRPQVATGGDDGVARIWQIQESAHQVIRQKSLIWDATFHPDSKRREIATASDENFTAWIWNFETGSEVTHLPNYDAWVRTLAFSPDGRELSIGLDDGITHVWDVGKKVQVNEIGGGDAITALAYAPTGAELAVGDLGGIVRFWSPDGSRTLRPMLDMANYGDHRQAKIDDLAYGATDKDLLIVEDNQTSVWDLDTGTEQFSVSHGDSPILSVAVSPQGDRFVTAGEDRTARIWDMATGAPLGNPMYHRDSVRSVDWAEFDWPGVGGQWIATASDDGLARIWNGDTGQEIARILHADPVQVVEFDRAGPWLLTVSNNVATVWNVENLVAFADDDLVPNLCKRLTRNFSITEWDQFFPDEAYRCTCGSLPPGPGANSCGK